MKSSSQNNYGYNKALKPNANRLRKEMTKTEACLWKYVLRAGGVMGFTFRRQRPVLDYIADFMCKDLMLIIEVDGVTHSYEEVVEKDQMKQRRLEQAGFKVLRFSDEAVLTQINRVAQAIEEEVMEIMRLNDISSPKPRKREREVMGVSSSPSPLPPPEGDIRQNEQ
ncbi:endonuclease domain-containing protein [Ekhidna sp. MALMAid0563]|uniref:endonuclease domain-containing protein n=1 Tax=Ekhidna sp. MALMAid0563 TaxID=3143937 RepID=UPI0032DE7FEB